MVIFCFFNREEVIPSPFMAVLENVPSKIVFEPHDGLLDLPMNNLQLKSFERRSVSLAPFKNCWLTSSPLKLMTFEVPLIISALTRGVDSPPSCSGQTGMRSYFKRSELIESEIGNVLHL